MSKQNKFSNNHIVSKSELGGCKLFEMRFERCHSEANTVRSNVDAPIPERGKSGVRLSSLSNSLVILPQQKIYEVPELNNYLVILL
jgi:hypothetical protein